MTGLRRIGLCYMKNKSCSILYIYRPLLYTSHASHLFFWSKGRSWGINPTVIMLGRVTGSVACVETPAVLWLRCSASGVPSASLPSRAVSCTHPGLLHSHPSHCFIKTANSPCSTNMVFSVLLELNCLSVQTE